MDEYFSMDNQLDCEVINRVDPLDEINVIDKQNLVTSYVMLVYNTLYSLGDSLAARLIRLLYEDCTLRNTNIIERDGDRYKISTINSRYVEFLTYRCDAPTEWDCSLFDDSVSLVLVLGISTHGCSVRQTIKSESTAVNDDGEEMIQQVVEETNARLAALNGERPNLLNDDLLEGQVNDDDNDSAVVYYEDPPLKRYYVETEVYNSFERDQTFGVEAESTLTFGFRLVSSPDEEPDDADCKLSIRVKTYVHYRDGLCILTSSTRMEESLSLTTHSDTEESKKVRGETPIISFSQTMDRQFATLIADGIANNYTAVIQIIGIALILYFGIS